MLSRQFLTWADRAAAGERADAARDLARAFLYADVDRIEAGELERAMTCLLDDPSPLVRRALAEALVGAAHAPHHLVSALAADQPDIAALVLGRSPILSDAELIDAAALGETGVQSAIAARPGLSAAVAGALAEVAGRDAVLVLCANHDAVLADVSFGRVLDRFGHDGEMRESLGRRPDTTPARRYDLVVATAEALRSFVADCGWMAPERARRVAGDAGARAAVALAGQGAGPEGLRFAAHLRRSGQLTPALVLRALMSGEMAFFEAALAELSGQAPSRVAGLVRRHDGLAFAALVRTAGLPDGLLPAIRAALDARRPAEASAQKRLRRDVVARALASYDAGVDLPVAGLMALLRRFEAEAARDEIRAAPPSARDPEAPALRHQLSPPAARRIEPRFDAVLDLAVAA